MRVGKQILLHLGPGLVAVGLFVLLNAFLPADGFPPFLILQIVLPALILVELGIVLFVGRRETGTLSFAKAIRFTARVKWWQLILLSAASIGWVVLVYSTIGDMLNRFVLSTFFEWLPGYFQLGGVLENPGLYSRCVRLSLWILTLIFGSLLFVMYHFWTPWLIPLRLLAILPMVYFVWWKKSFQIGVVAHCTLNLVSDVILTVPILLV